MARLDWNSLKSKVKQAAGNVTDLAKEASQKAVEAWDSEDALKLRKEVSSGIDNVKDTVSQKATELWNNEEAMKLREKLAAGVDGVRETSEAF